LQPENERVLRKILLTISLLTLAVGFWLSPNFKVIAAGLALFLFGMLSLEEGFKAFTGGPLEAVLRKSTSSIGKSIFLGIASTSITQSSSLVSLITISFLSAGLMDLGAGIGIIFGANLGTTTGAWLIAGLGLKVNISSYAMPLLVFGVLLIFQNSRALRGIGQGLVGLGLLFLGIHFMKEGFDAFSQTIDLAEYAVPGYPGLFLFAFIGILATVVLQSSHATLVLIITALAAQQITYDNAMALAIGANVGTTVTAMLGALSANIEGKRLAVAHLIFNVSTGLLAIALLPQLIYAVDWIALRVGINNDDYTLKLALFHTLFNLIGLLVMTPWIPRMVVFLERVLQAPATDRTQPIYLSEASLDVPAAAVESVRKELTRLYENAFHLVAHGLSLNRGTIKSEKDLASAVAKARRLMPVDVDEYYARHIKPLHSAIIEFIGAAQTRSLPLQESDQLNALREASRNIVEAVKAMKHLHKNLSRSLRTDNAVLQDQYDGIRLQLANILRELNNIQDADPASDTILSLDAAALYLKESVREQELVLNKLIRQRRISALDATSLMNDNAYACDISANLIEMARPLFGSTSQPEHNAEQQLSLGETDLAELDKQLE
jgi:phosphate:Na+ symporter